MSKILIKINLKQNYFNQKGKINILKILFKIFIYGANYEIKVIINNNIPCSI